MGDYADDAIENSMTWDPIYGDPEVAWELYWETGENPYPIVTSPKKDREHAKALEDPNLCPRCNSALTMRTNSYTKDKFIGCTRFPKCYYSRPI